MKSKRCDVTTRQQWDNDPENAFKAFLSSPSFAETSTRRSATPLSEQTRANYVFRISRFTCWLQREGLRFTRVSHSDLVRYGRFSESGSRQPSPNLSKDFTLLSRCYRYLGIEPNPASEALATQRGERLARGEPMRVLSDAEISALMGELDRFEARRAASTRDKEMPYKHIRAMLCLMLYGGLCATEVRHLQVEDIDDPLGSTNSAGALMLKVRSLDRSRPDIAREVTVRSAAAIPLRAWLAQRAAIYGENGYVFPQGAGNGSGPKPLGDLLVSVQGTFDNAGLGRFSSYVRVLRNTFIAGELRSGATPEEVCASIGCSNSHVVDWFFRLQSTPSAVLAKPARVTLSVAAAADSTHSYPFSGDPIASLMNDAFEMFAPDGNDERKGPTPARHRSGFDRDSAEVVEVCDVLEAPKVATDDMAAQFSQRLDGVESKLDHILAALAEVMQAVRDLERPRSPVSEPASEDSNVRADVARMASELAQHHRELTERRSSVMSKLASLLQRVDQKEAAIDAPAGGALVVVESAGPKSRPARTNTKERIRPR